MVMHVLIIPYNYPTVEFPQRAIFIADQVKTLRNSGNKVSVLGCIPKTINDVIKTKKFNFGQIKNQPWLMCTPAIRGVQSINDFISLNFGKYLFKKYLKQESRPDIIHVHNSSAAKLALWIKHSYGIPYVITEHSSQLWDFTLLNNKQFIEKQTIYKESKVNIAVSESFATHLSEVFNVFFQYIPNVVDTDFFVPVEKKQSQSKVIRICSVGNLTRNKNHTLLIRTVSSLIESGINIELTIAGGGTEFSSLQAQIESLSIADKVKLLGSQNRHQVLSILQLSDYFVLPSIKETFGVVLIEAISCGLPVLALNNGGSNSIINESVGVVSASEEEFLECLSTLISNNYDRQMIKQYAVENYSPEVIGKQLLKVYLS
jgi:glycosyltransferase involved in cell wall biosynthesis